MDLTLRAQFTGAPGTTPGRYQILFIHEGKANGWTFSRQVLQDSAALWEGASVFVDHSFWGMPSVRDLGAVLSNAAWSDEFAGLTADLTLAGPSKEIIREAADITMRDGPTPNIGFSADVVITADAAGNVTRILQPYSVDLVVDPAFATKFIRTLNQQQHTRKEHHAEPNRNPPHHRRRQPTAAAEVDATRATLNALVLDTALAVSDIPDKAKDAIRASLQVSGHHRRRRCSGRYPGLEGHRRRGHRPAGDQRPRPRLRHVQQRRSDPGRR